MRAGFGVVGAGGVVNGSWSLTRSLLGAPTSIVSKVTGALGRAVAQFSLDDDYLRSRDNAAAGGPRHAMAPMPPMPLPTPPIP